MSSKLTLTRDLLTGIKELVEKAQLRAVASVNAEMIALYWNVGRLIVLRKKDEGWGSGVIPRLAVDLKNELPEHKGFSISNLERMVKFNREYPTLFSIPSPLVTELAEATFNPETDRDLLLGVSWSHNDDQPTIGMILCQTKDRILAEYSLRDINKPIGVADYELTRALPDELATSLPSIETIEAELSLDLKDDA